MSALRKEFHHWQFYGTEYQQVMSEEAGRVGSDNVATSSAPAVESQQSIIPAVERAAVNVNNDAPQRQIGPQNTPPQTIVPKKLPSKAKARTLGEFLKSKRVEYGVSHADAAAYLNIRAGHLKAIEEARYHDLPGRVYITGFIRSYAQYLGVDPEMAVKLYKKETGAVAPKEEILNFPVAASETKVPDIKIIMMSVGGLVALIILVAVLFSGGEEAENLTEIPTPVAEIEQAVTENLMAMEQAPTSTGQAAMSVPADTNVAALTDIPVPPAVETVVVSTEAPLSSNEDRSLKAAESRPTVYGAVNVDARIIIRANENSWVEMRSGVGTVLLTRVLKKGDLYYVPNEKGVNITTGNAGGLDFIVDGKVKGTIGERGQVLRNFELSADKFIKTNGG